MAGDAFQVDAQEQFSRGDGQRVIGIFLVDIHEIGIVHMVGGQKIDRSVQPTRSRCVREHVPDHFVVRYIVQESKMYIVMEEVAALCHVVVGDLEQFTEEVGPPREVGRFRLVVVLGIPLDGHQTVDHPLALVRTRIG